jgi:hypothetical protein
VVLTLAAATAPAILFFDPADFVPRRGHIPREPLSTYELFSDDIAYLASSRTWPRAVAHLFTPHNTHVIPAWRVVTWALAAGAGGLERMPVVLAVASYAILVVVMLLTGRLVARETGQTGLGFAAMILVGTTSLMLTPATWYAAGQPLWAGAGILSTLWYAQTYRRSGQIWALLPATLTAPIAGWFWTMGHMAGPVAAVYLFCDGRRRSRLAALIPLAASVVGASVALGLGGREIDSTISFHGRTLAQAFHPIQGALNAAQAIPENLVLGNLGLSARTTPTQGVILTLAILCFWTRRLWQQPVPPDSLGQEPSPWDSHARRLLRAFSPLECAGAALVLGTYLVEWAFRGYETFQNLRTLNLRFIVPWYDAIPHIGGVLFVIGWYSARRNPPNESRLPGKALPLSRGGAVGLCVLAACLIALNRPRVDALVRATVPRLLPSEQKRFPIPRLQTIRANAVISDRAEWQRAHLRGLDTAEQIARRMGLGRDALHAAFGHPWVPGSVGALRPELYALYDAIGLLDLPEAGRSASPAEVRRALGGFFAQDREPRPNWIAPNEPWPPHDESETEK